MTSSFVYYSNRFENLYELLRNRLYGAVSSPFFPRYVVVPGWEIKEWLQRRLADDPLVGIAAGITFLSVEVAVAQLCGSLNLPTPMEIALRLEVELRRWIHEGGSAELLRYTGDGSERHLLSLARRLGRHFYEYGLYGAEQVAKWELGDSDDWQAELWRRLYSIGGWEYPSRLIRHIQIESQVGWHLFGFSHLSPPYYDLFSRVGAAFYTLSPTPLYMGDLLSDRQIERVRRHTREGLWQELGSYLADRNSLLANWSQFSRPLMVRLAEAAQEDQAYSMPGRERLLHCLQSDLYELGVKESVEVLPPDDSSVELHVVSSRWREVEVMHDRILSWMERERHAGRTPTPDDVLVLAPDIALYVPFLEAVFEESGLPYQVAEGARASSCSLFSGLLRLLRLAFSRWEAGALLALLEHELFAATSKLGPEDVERIRRWVDDVSIRWGGDAEHRQALLRFHYGEDIAAPMAPQMTWSHGLDLLFRHLAVGDLDMSEVELLTRLEELITSLRDDLSPLLERTTYSLKEWADYLEALSRAYFHPDFDSQVASREREWWLGQLEEMHRGALHLEGESFLFDSIRPWILDWLEQRTGRLGINNWASVRCRSFKAHSVTPAPLICLLGMEEGVVPAPSPSSPLDRLRDASPLLRPPRSGDRDRYLMLEMLLSARSALFLSYCRFSAEGVDHPPSLLIEELCHYLDAHYRLGDRLPSEAMTYYHSALPCDAAYFSKGANPSFSQRGYRLALAQTGERPPPFHFLPLQTPALHLPQGEEVTRLSLWELRRSFTAPLSLYFEHTLDLPIRDQDELKEEEEFALPRFWVGRFVQEALADSFDSAWNHAQNEGWLPMGALEEVARSDLRRCYEESLEALHRFGVESVSPYSLELSSECQERRQVDKKHFRTPALALDLPDGSRVELVGSLRNVLADGVAFYAKSEKIDLLKAAPSLLVAEALARRGEEAIASRALFMRGESYLMKSSQESLCALVRYALLCRRYPSPFHVGSLESVMRGEVAKAAERLRKDLSDGRMGSPYYAWCWPQPAAMEVEEWMAAWQPELQRVTTRLAACWQKEAKA